MEARKPVGEQQDAPEGTEVATSILRDRIVPLRQCVPREGARRSRLASPRFRHSLPASVPPRATHARPPPRPGSPRPPDGPFSHPHP